MRLKLLGFALTVVLLLPACASTTAPRDPNSGENLVSLRIQTMTEKLDFQVEIADTVFEREKGLMYRNELPENQGMLFVFEKAQPVSFWMKNTRIPLDMVFISADKKIISIQKNALPCQADPCGGYPSRSAVQYVLELNGGISDTMRIGVGDTVDFSL